MWGFNTHKRSGRKGERRSAYRSNRGQSGCQETWWQEGVWCWLPYREKHSNQSKEEFASTSTPNQREKQDVSANNNSSDTINTLSGETDIQDASPAQEEIVVF